MTKSIRLHLPDALYERVRRLAASRNLDLHDFLLNSLVLPNADSDDSVLRATIDQDAQVLWQEEQAFQALHPTLIEQYAGQYVAIHNRQLVDHDLDQIALYRRCRQVYPAQPVLIVQVQQSTEEVYTFRSPRMLENPINGSIQS